MNTKPAILTLFVLFCLSAPTFAQGRFAVQFEAVPARTDAEEKAAQLKANGVQAYIVKSNVPGKGVFFRIRAGNFAGKPAADAYGRQLKTQGVVSDYFVAPYEQPETPLVAKAAPAPVKQPAPPPAPVPTPKPSAPPVKQPVRATAEPVKTTAVAAPTTAPASAPVTSPAADSPKPVTVTPGAGGNAPTVGAATPAVNATGAAGFNRYQDAAAGYSFEIPQYWLGGSLTADEIKAQRVAAGAVFKSNEDAAFLNAIWNKLEKANSPDHDNDMIVDLILKSMGSGNGTQNITSLSRRVVNEGGIIKTFLDLRAAFQVPNQPSPLDFLGKAVIIRASKGILLVVTFYSKDAPPTVPQVAEKIILTARVPD